MTQPVSTARPQTARFAERFYRSALGRFPTGVTIITAEDPHDGAPIGLTISSFASVSLEPPLVLWALTHDAMSLAAFQQLDRYVIHVLSAQQIPLAQRFARGSHAQRFDGVALRRTPDGTLMLDDARCAAWFECTNRQQHEAGDHTIFVGEVQACHWQPLAPLIYHAGDFELTASGDPLSRN